MAAGAADALKGSIGMQSSPHQVYECSKVRVLLVGTTCSSWPLKTARSASGPAAVTTHAFVPYALATAAAYEIAPPCFSEHPL